MVAPRALDSCRRPEGSYALGTRMNESINQKIRISAFYAHPRRCTPSWRHTNEGERYPKWHHHELILMMSPQTPSWRQHEHSYDVITNSTPPPRARTHRLVPSLAAPKEELPPAPPVTSLRCHRDVTISQTFIGAILNKSRKGSIGLMLHPIYYWRHTV